MVGGMHANILLHLGMPKTGTSVLQNALAALAEREPERVIYPRRFRGHKVAHHDLAAALRAGPADVPAIAAALMEEARDAAAPVAYSSEGLHVLCTPAGAPNLEDLAAAVPLRAVLVVREMTAFFEAMFLQSARFGTIRMSFADYVASRSRWTRDLFHGVAHLAADHGGWFEAVMQRPGTDTLALGDRWLGLPAGTLADAARSLPSTGRRTLKEEAALAFAPEVSERLGMDLSRQEMMALFQTGRGVFADDCSRFTLYHREERRALMERVLAQAREAGLTCYVEAFAEAEPPDMERRDIGPDVLTDADLAALREAMEEWRAHT